MTRILRSFADLADALAFDDMNAEKLVDGSDDPANEPALDDLETLQARLDEAAATLEEATRVHVTARAEVRRVLEAYEERQARRDAAAEAVERAHELMRRADDLHAGALDLATRSAAEHAREVADRVHASARRTLADLERDLETRRQSPTLARALEARNQEQATADARERSQRLDELAGAIQRALDADQLDDARRLLDDLAREAPGSALVQALEENLRARRRGRRLGDTEHALLQARRAFRRAPDNAVARLERLDLDGLPTELRRQLVGFWVDACLHVCARRAIDDARLYPLPQPGYGVVIARERPGAPYAVISSLGGEGRYAPGATVSDAVARAARRLDGLPVTSGIASSRQGDPGAH